VTAASGGSLPVVPDLEDVRRIALELPGASERAGRSGCQWRVAERLFVWERSLRDSEIRSLEGPVPEGPILAARVEHLGAKEALLADGGDSYFTTSHFDGHPSVLVRLDAVPLDELRELIVEAWLCRAPPRVASEYLAALADADGHDDGGGERGARSLPGDSGPRARGGKRR
jgi:hypothetical protein